MFIKSLQLDYVMNRFRARLYIYILESCELIFFLVAMHWRHVNFECNLKL